MLVVQAVRKEEAILAFNALGSPIFLPRRPRHIVPNQSPSLHLTLAARATLFQIRVLHYTSQQLSLQYILAS